MHIHFGSCCARLVLPVLALCLLAGCAAPPLAEEGALPAPVETIAAPREQRPTPAQMETPVPTAAPEESLEDALWERWESVLPEAASEDGLFRLSLAGNADAHPAGEPLDLAAALAYLGEAPEITLVSGSPLVHFLIRGSGFASGELWTAYVQLHTPVSKEAPLIFPFRLHTVFSPGSRDEAFFMGAYQKEELRLPPGEYELLALASFIMQGGAAPGYELLAGTRILVEGGQG